MFPVLLKIGPITLYTFGLAIVVAFLVASWYVRRRAARDLGLDRERVFNVCFALLFLGILGARMLQVIVHYTEYTKEPLKFVKIWDGGLSLYGGMIAGALWLAWYLPRHPDLKGLAFFDVLALGAALAIGIGSIGTFLSGDAHGKPTDVAWGVKFPPVSGVQSPVPSGISLHPTQLYHSLHGFLCFAIVWAYLRRPRPAGRGLALFLMLYALGRAAIEPFRGDANRGMVIDDVLSVPMLLCVPTFFAGLAIWLIRKSPAPSEAVSRA